MQLTWEKDNWGQRIGFILKTAVPLAILNFAVILLFSVRPLVTLAFIGLFFLNVGLWARGRKTETGNTVVSCTNLSIFVGMAIVSGKDSPTWLLFLPPLVPMLFAIHRMHTKIALVLADNIAATGANVLSGKGLVTTVSVAVALVAVSVLLFRTFRFLKMQSDAIEREREQSDRLLLNILPEEIATELKTGSAVKPVCFDSASVLFTDFQGFTKIAESLSPEDLVGELDRCFSYFDAVTARHNLEKLKTIGDSFMCAGGIPIPNQTHAVDCILAAVEIQAFMNQMKALKAENGLPYWELRLGIHSGPLVAGVIGEKKFAYDVWGDTVNTASRAESSGAVGRINITGATYERVRDYFNCEHRGTVAAKNKGEIDMYFVNGIQPALSRDGDGRVPNEKFRDMLQDRRSNG